jgi:hypothetical protein
MSEEVTIELTNGSPAVFEAFQRIANDKGRITVADNNGKGTWAGRLVIDSIANGVLRAHLVEVTRVAST